MGTIRAAHRPTRRPYHPFCSFAICFALLFFCIFAPFISSILYFLWKPTRRPYHPFLLFCSFAFFHYSFAHFYILIFLRRPYHPFCLLLLFCLFRSLLYFDFLRRPYQTFCLFALLLFCFCFFTFLKLANSSQKLRLSYHT